MKRKYFLSILLALILGYLCANYVLALYKEDSYNNIIYFLQAGAYNNKESSLNDLKDIDNKIIIKENDKYYMYIGITADIKIAKRIKNMYKNKNIELYIKEKDITNTSFKLELEQYDILLKNAKTFDEVNAIFKTVLATYEEGVLSK